MAGATQDAQKDNVVQFLTPSETRVRLEIDEFLADNELTNLLLLALSEIQKEPSKAELEKRKLDEDWWTSYSLSTIHGQPVESWDKIDQKSSNYPLYGYCTHGMIQFPTWHRVYVGMFEQSVANKVQEIAKRFTKEPERSVYQNAADRFRLPFWDPLLPRNNPPNDPLLPRSNVPITKFSEDLFGIPKILAAPTVHVKIPQEDGSVVEDHKFTNPLYSFKFPDIELLKEKNRKLISWPEDVLEPGRLVTVRAPSSSGESHIMGNEDKDAPPEDPLEPNGKWSLNLRIQRQVVTYATKLWKLLSPYDREEPRKFEVFAAHYKLDPKTGDKDPKDPAWVDPSISLESWHDLIHVLVGTGDGNQGHMANPAIAGFDPVFFLHHNNIDRLFALYQALNPTSWFPDNFKNKTTDPLYPFRKYKGNSKDDFWTADEIKDWKNLGFAIPGHQDLDKDGQTLVAKHIKDYYEWIGEKKPPPKSVWENWPKDLSSSYALRGAEARVVDQPALVFEAIGPSALIHRSVAISTPKSPEVSVEDEIKTVEVKPTPVNSAPKGVLEKDANNTTTQLTWNARVRVKKFAFNGSFVINLFLGEINDSEPVRYFTKKNEVGYTGVFATAWEAPCANCVQQREDGLVYEDAIPITPVLTSYLASNNVPEADGPKLELRTLEGFSEDQVVPFLKKNLRWRVTDTSSRPIEEGRWGDAGLEIRVSSRKFTLPTPEYPLGIYHPITPYPSITEDLVGGYGYGGAPTVD